MPNTIPEGFIPVSDAFEQAVSALADFSQLSIDQTASDDEQRDYFNKHDEIVRGVAKKMRKAIADRGLPLFIDTPNGPRELVERKEWGELAFGVPNIENLSHHLTNPGVDTDGQPSLLKISDFRDWLTAHNPNNSSALVDTSTSSSPALNMPKEMSELDAVVSWSTWTERTGEYTGSQKRFLEQLESRPGIVPKRHSHGRGFYGLRVLSSAVGDTW